MNKPNSLFSAARRLRAIADRPEQEALDLLAVAWRRAPVDILAQPKTPPAGVLRRWQAYIRRRAAGEPFAYIVGWQPFMGLRITVSRATLIPRPATEEIVAAVLSDFPNQALACLDIGTGSGCVALALQAARPRWDCLGTDTSRAALLVARRNARRLKLPVRFLVGTWPITPQFDVIVANLPYLNRAEAAKKSLRFEPSAALLGGGTDGLRIYRELIQKLPDTPAQALYLECLPRQIRPLGRIISRRWPNAKQRPILFGRSMIGWRVTWPVSR